MTNMTAADKTAAPPLPDKVSPDGSELWDWAGQMSQHIQKEARKAELRKELRTCGKECGDCEKWMKSRECPMERPGKGKQSGHSVGPSMSAPICGQYVETLSTTQRRAKLTEELNTLL